MRESVGNSTWQRRTTALSRALLTIGLLALALAAPAVAQPSDPAPKKRLKPTTCVMLIFVMVKDGVRHRCWYRADPKLGCVPLCDPPLSRSR
jgi:hypothetical protein